jgi:polyribonucleotide nucleotidyltransferase
MVLSATTAQSKPREAIDFFPLTVDVEERMYAVGRIPGSFFRREGRPSEGAILTCRLIDRPLRPCFVKGLRNEVQVIVTVMALNPNKTYDVVAINAASLSTQLAGLPFTGPVGGVRVALSEIAGSASRTSISLRMPRSRWSCVAGHTIGDVAHCHGRGRVDDAGTWDLVRSGKTAPTEEVVAAGLEAAKPFMPRIVCGPRLSWRPSSPSPLPTSRSFSTMPPTLYEVVAETATAGSSRASCRLLTSKTREHATETLKNTVVERLASAIRGREKEITGA